MMCLRRTDAATLKSIIKNCVREVATADAESQLAQRSAWMDLNRGFPLAAGLDHLEYLGVTEVKLTLRLEPVAPGFWAALAGRMTGRKPRARFRLCGDTAQQRGCFSLAITISRGAGGNAVVRTEPNTATIEDSYVVDVTS